MRKRKVSGISNCVDDNFMVNGDGVCACDKRKYSLQLEQTGTVAPAGSRIPGAQC